MQRMAQERRRQLDQVAAAALNGMEGVDGIQYDHGKYVLKTKSREEAFDRVVFAMPVQQVVKLLRGTPWEPFLEPYENNTATEVMVYDVGLSTVVARPFSYISDMNHKMFISDVSATDHTLVPDGGQLLQGIAYLSDENAGGEGDRKAYLEERTQQMEALFDRHYPGWRDAVAVKRVSKKAMVQSVKNIASNKLLPVRIENMPFYFCGDGCEGKGELAERAFSSGRHAAELLSEGVGAAAGNAGVGAGPGGRRTRTIGHSGGQTSRTLQAGLRNIKEKRPRIPGGITRVVLLTFRSFRL